LKEATELEYFCASLLQFINPELLALLAGAAGPAEAGLINTGHDHFTRLAERDNTSVTLCVYQARVVGALNWAALTRA